MQLVVQNICRRFWGSLTTRIRSDSMPKRAKRSSDVGESKRARSGSCQPPYAQPPLINRLTMPANTQILPTPAKSANDKKDYRVIRLDNGLTALLISDASYPLDKLDEEEEKIEAKHKLEAASSTDVEADNGEDGEEEGEEEEEEEEGEEEEGGEEAESGCEEEEDEEEDSGEAPTPSKRNIMEATGLRMSAAGLCIHVGSFSDPPDIPGLAHFLEHMVFMGTTKYPDENAFDVFNRKHGGHDNAHTDCETTTFYFETPRRHFAEGLERFAQFFISPLMKLGSMQREREAVHSEFEMALPSDYDRVQQMFGGLAKDNHPMSKFMWGSLQSLSPEGMSDQDMHARLHQFRERHYTAQSMCLAVQSQHTLDQMQAWVEETFALVPNNGLERESFDHLTEPFATPRFHKLYRFMPVQNVYQVDFAWALPPLQGQYRTKPLHYLAWIIGHEGRGSLLAFLRRKVWALSLTAGNQGDGFEQNSCYSLFTITIILTKLGYENIEQVISAVFSYLKMLQKAGPSQRIFKEIQKIEILDFEHKEEKHPMDSVETLCENMHFYPPERYLDGDDLIFDYDPELIQDCSERLRFDMVNIFLRSKDLNPEKLDKVEPWFKTSYSECDIPETWQHAAANFSLVSEFHLPEPNPFIAEDTTLVEAAEGEEAGKHPLRIRSDELGELFYKQDLLFRQPRAYINYLIRSPFPLHSLEKSVLMDLMVMCLLQSMVEDVYPADLAQLSYSLYASESGIVIKTSGLSDKLPRLLETILQHFHTLDTRLEESLFQAVLEQLRKNYHNHAIRPKKLVRDVRLSVLQDVYWSPHEKHNVVRKFSLERLRQFIKEFRTQGFLQGLVQGNLTKSQALEADSIVRKYLDLQPLSSEALTEIRCKELPVGDHNLRVKSLNPGDANTMVTNYYQGGAGSVRDHAILEVFTMMMEEPVFDTLRTREQLGYSVFNTLRNTFGVLGFSITVNTQANKFTAQHADSRIEVFLQKFLEENLNQEQVAQAIAALSKLKVRADVTLEEDVNRNWGEITSKEYCFNRLERELAVLSSLTLSHVLDYVRPLALGETRRKISVQVVGYHEERDQAELTELNSDERVFSLEFCPESSRCLTDIASFKAKAKTFPILYIVD